jgi:Fe-S-cluster containining protein
MGDGVGNTQRTVLRELNSGAIELVWDGVFTRIEFNCSCLEALPFCNAMCCRQRPGYSIELEDHELSKFAHKSHPSYPDIQLVQTAGNGLDCIYLEDGKCSVHTDKPEMCQKWHCSPRGEVSDSRIERRDAGWMLMPMRREEAQLIQKNLEGRS